MVTGALALGPLLALLRGEPRWNGDQGVFLSIAARMLDGDRLYADVIDNKEPLFFYAHAGALWIGGWKAPAALDGLWLALAALSIGLLLDRLGAPGPAVVAGFVSYPAALVAGWYEPGLTMLAGLVVAPFAAWLWVRGSFVLSGVALATALSFKLSIALVAIAPLVALVALGSPAGPRLRHGLRALGGFALASVAVSAFLAARGELRGFLEVLEYDLTYPDTAQEVQGKSDGIGSHLDVTRQFFLASGRWQFPAALLLVAALAVAAVLGRRRGGRSFVLLAGLATATLVAALVTLALTAIWVHHLQMLALPAALAGATLVAFAATSLGQRAGVVAAAACVAFALWVPLQEELDTFPTSAWAGPPYSTGAELLEEARVRFYPNSEEIPYVVFGSNSDNAHAAFIDDAFDLACRWFHLYPHSSREQLAETIECAHSRSPELALVTVGFFEPRGPLVDWNAFVADVGALLRERYELVDDRERFQVWRKMQR